MTDDGCGKRSAIYGLNDEQRSDVKWMVSNFHWTIHQAVDAIRDGWKRSDFEKNFEDSKQSDTQNHSLEFERDILKLYNMIPHNKVNMLLKECYIDGNK